MSNVKGWEPLNISGREYNLLDVVYTRWRFEDKRSAESLADALAISPSWLSTLVSGMLSDLEVAQKLGVESWIRCVFLYGQIRNGFKHLDGFPKELPASQRVEFLRDAMNLLLSEAVNLRQSEDI